MVLLQVALEWQYTVPPLLFADVVRGSNLVVLVVINVTPLLAVEPPQHDTDGADHNQATDATYDATDDLLGS